MDGKFIKLFNTITPFSGGMPPRFRGVSVAHLEAGKFNSQVVLPFKQLFQPLLKKRVSIVQFRYSLHQLFKKAGYVSQNFPYGYFFAHQPYCSYFQPENIQLFIALSSFLSTATTAASLAISDFDRGNFTSNTCEETPVWQAVTSLANCICATQ